MARRSRESKHDMRMARAVARIAETGLPLAYVNQVGGQDELVFDGASFALNPGGDLAFQARAWEEAVALTSVATRRRRLAGRSGRTGASGRRRGGGVSGLRAGAARLCAEERFPGVVLGMSGGVDSGAVRGPGRGRAGRLTRCTV